MTFVDPGDFVALQVVDETDMDNIRNDLLFLNNRVFPTGALTPFTGTVAPTGWFLCDGTAVSRTTYAALYAITGDAYGPGNGSTTFNLPNLQQKFPMGKAASGTGSTLGANGGSKDAIAVTHDHGSTGGQSATHTHPATASDYLFITNHLGITVATGTGPDTVFSGAWEIPSTGNASAGHTHTVGSAGSSGTDANLPAYQVFTYIIKF